MSLFIFAQNIPGQLLDINNNCSGSGMAGKQGWEEDASLYIHCLFL